MKIHLYLFKKYFIYVYMAANNIIIVKTNYIIKTI